MINILNLNYINSLILFFSAVNKLSNDYLDRVSVPSPIAIDILMDTMARDRAHMYWFSV